MSERAIFKHRPIKYSRECTDLSNLFYSYQHFTHSIIMKNNPDFSPKQSNSTLNRKCN